MRSRLFGALAGALGFAALAAATSDSNVDTCASAPPSTVSITVQSVVTIHDGPTRTVYIDVSEVPTTTLTRVETRTKFTTQASSTPTLTNAALVTTPEYDTTITETVLATITNYQVVAASSGGSVTYSESAAPNGLLTYVVVNGTTYWLNGQTPVPSQSYVVRTSVVTVQPYHTLPPVSEDDETSTLTLTKTIFSTKPITITETMAPGSSSSTKITSPTQSLGTGSPGFTGVASGGWNATSTAGGIFGTGSSTTTTITTTSLPIPILNGYLPPINVTGSLAAFSGFHVSDDPATSATSSVALYANTTSILATRSALGVFTSALTTSCTGNSSTVAAASTTSGARSTAIPVNSRSPASAIGVSTASAAFTSRLPFVNSTTSVVVSSTSSALGVFTFEAPTSSAPNSTTLALSTASTFLGAPISLSSGIANSPTQSSSVATSTSSISSTGASSSPAITLSTSFTVSSSSSQLSSSAFSTISSLTSTSATSSASASPSSCGEVGDFTLNFDDIPPLSIGNQSAATVDPMPVFNPYHQFDFSDGFVVVPPPTDPYLPSSKPLLLEFIPNFNVNGSNPQSGPNARELGWSGDVGNGDHGLTGCFSFNAYGANFGCDSLGDPCHFSFSGYRYDRNTGATNLVTQQSISVIPCASLTSLKCELQEVALNDSFQNLDSFRINVTVAGEPKIWWMDDLHLGWYNNTCNAGLCGLRTHIH